MSDCGSWEVIQKVLTAFETPTLFVNELGLKKCLSIFMMNFLPLPELQRHDL